MLRIIFLFALIILIGACNAGKKSSVLKVGGQSTSISCPSGYVAVKGNSLFSTSDFCVMKFEAKCQEISTSNFCSPSGGVYDATKVAVSDTDGAPWTDINPIDAKSACKALGDKYDLTSNDEWMTIARDAEAQSSNWFTGTVGDGCILHGNANRDSDCTYRPFSVDYGSSRDPKAKLILKNSSEIYDLAGNVNEWVDWVKGGSFDKAPTTCSFFGNINIYDWICNDIPTNAYMPGNPANATDYGLVSGNGLGKEFGSSDPSQGAAYRGGSYYSATAYGFAGIFALGLNYDETTQMFQTGFRCVYRP